MSSITLTPATSVVTLEPQLSAAEQKKLEKEQKKIIEKQKRKRKKAKERRLRFMQMAAEQAPAGSLLGSIATGASTGAAIGGPHGAAIGAAIAGVGHIGNMAYNKYQKNKKFRKAYLTNRVNELGPYMVMPMVARNRYNQMISEARAQQIRQLTSYQENLNQTMLEALKWQQRRQEQMRNEKEAAKEQSEKLNNPYRKQTPIFNEFGEKTNPVVIDKPVTKVKNEYISDPITSFYSIPQELKIQSTKAQARYYSELLNNNALNKEKAVNELKYIKEHPAEYKAKFNKILKNLSPEVRKGIENISISLISNPEAINLSAAKKDATFNNFLSKAKLLADVIAGVSKATVDHDVITQVKKFLESKNLLQHFPNENYVNDRLNASNQRMEEIQKEVNEQLETITKNKTVLGKIINHPELAAKYTNRLRPNVTWEELDKMDINDYIEKNLNSVNIKTEILNDINTINSKLTTEERNRLIELDNVNKRIAELNKTIKNLEKTIKDPNALATELETPNVERTMHIHQKKCIEKELRDIENDIDSNIRLKKEVSKYTVKAPEDLTGMGLIQYHWNQNYISRSAGWAWNKLKNMFTSADYLQQIADEKKEYLHPDFRPEQKEHLVTLQEKIASGLRHHNIRKRLKNPNDYMDLEELVGDPRVDPDKLDNEFNKDVLKAFVHNDKLAKEKFDEAGIKSPKDLLERRNVIYELGSFQGKSDEEITAMWEDNRLKSKELFNRTIGEEYNKMRKNNNIDLAKGGFHKALDWYSNWKDIEAGHINTVRDAAVKYNLAQIGDGLDAHYKRFMDALFKRDLKTDIKQLPNLVDNDKLTQDRSRNFLTYFYTGATHGKSMKIEDELRFLEEMKDTTYMKDRNGNITHIWSHNLPNEDTEEAKLRTYSLINARESWMAAHNIYPTEDSFNSTNTFNNKGNPVAFTPGEKTRATEAMINTIMLPRNSKKEMHPIIQYERNKVKGNLMAYFDRRNDEMFTMAEQIPEEFRPFVTPKQVKFMYHEAENKTEEELKNIGRRIARDAELYHNFINDKLGLKRVNNLRKNTKDETLGNALSNDDLRFLLIAHKEDEDPHEIINKRIDKWNRKIIYTPDEVEKKWIEENVKEEYFPEVGKGKVVNNVLYINAPTHTGKSIKYYRRKDTGKNIYAPNFNDLKIDNIAVTSMTNDNSVFNRPYYTKLDPDVEEYRKRYLKFDNNYDKTKIENNEYLTVGDVLNDYKLQNMIDDPNYQFRKVNIENRNTPHGNNEVHISNIADDSGENVHDYAFA